MQCTRCHSEVSTVYKHGDQSFCGLCVMELSHINFKPNRCAQCGELITTLLPLTAPDGRRFCGVDCLATSMGFVVDKETPKEIKSETDQQQSDTEKISS